MTARIEAETRGWLRDAWEALRFNTRVYDGLRLQPDAFLRGLVIVVAVSLLTGLPGFVRNLVDELRPAQTTEVAEVNNAISETLDAVDSWLERAGTPADVRTQVIEQMRASTAMSLEIAAQVEALPTPLPRTVSAVLTAFGHWASRPFAGSPIPLAAATLGTWLGYGIWVMLAAKRLGGHAALHSFFGATALFALPHVLDLFRWVPIIGPVLGLVAFFWGLAIYVKATQISHEFAFERALLAVLAPILALILLVFIVASTLMGIATLRAL